MKKNLLLAFLLFGFLGFAQQTKKKTYKKPVKKLEEVKPIDEEKKKLLQKLFNNH